MAAMAIELTVLYTIVVARADVALEKSGVDNLANALAVEAGHADDGTVGHQCTTKMETTRDLS